jgi:hypothetical protein
LGWHVYWSVDSASQMSTLEELGCPPVIEKMLLMLYTQEEAEVWWARPNRMLGGELPCALVACGRQYEVERILQQIIEGVYI